MTGEGDREERMVREWQDKEQGEWRREGRRGHHVRLGEGGAWGGGSVEEG